MLPKDSVEQHRWYALRVTYSRELIVQRHLAANGIESYVPMHYIEQDSGGVKRKKLVPAIHNLIFVRITNSEMKEFKASTELPIRYIMDRETHEPIVIPNKQMEDFKAVVEANSDHVEIVESQLPQLEAGMRVRITDGVFRGIEGIYLRYKGHSKVAVSIQGIATVLTAFVPAKFIESID